MTSQAEIEINTDIKLSVIDEFRLDDQFVQLYF